MMTLPAPGKGSEAGSSIEYALVAGVPDGPMVEAIIELYRAGGWWEESEHARASLPDLVRGSFCFVVARSPGGDLVGMARAISDGVSDAYIQDVVVHEAWRGRGIGRELVRRVRDVCVAHRLEWIGLVAEPGTAPFYEELGFEVLERHEAMRLRP